MVYQQILSQLPYSQPFLFVDQLTAVDENGARGNFLFREDSYFYKGHFKGNPVTPGVILTECMAQIGLVCLGIFLLNSDSNEGPSKLAKIALSSAEVEFLAPVFPGEKVEVTSEKVYFRFNKLKCRTLMKDSEGKVVCKGIISGMIKTGE